MISANEARQAVNSRNIDTILELQIDPKIRKAAESGRRSIEIDYSTFKKDDEAVIRKLRQLGYCASFVHEVNKDRIIVSW